MFLYLVNADLRCLLHIVANIFFLQFQLFCHPRRSMRTSASVGADVCVGRCGYLRRSMRMSASVDADDVCILKKVA